MDELLKDFLVEAAEHIESVGNELVLFERDPSDAHIIASIFRLVHTIKGTCGFLGLPRLAHLAHAAEALIARLRDGAPATHQRVSLILAAIDRIKLILAALENSAHEPQGDDADLITALNSEIGFEPLPCGDGPLSIAPLEPVPGEPPGPPAKPAPHRSIRSPSTIRVSVGALERIMTLVSELVLTRNQLLEITRRLTEDPIKPPLQRLSSLTSDLQDAVMRARMQPIGRLFANLPRLVRELASDVGKKIELVTAGSETELDRQLIELIRDPLTHMLRNCADHGIETPQERRAAGKPEAGTIRVSAAHEAGHIIIALCDDGRGLDVERIRAKALSLGLSSDAQLARMTSDEICNFIFTPGFSTACQVTSISGRGIGMDVVRENIEAIGGTVTLSTALGRGTTFALKIPLTLAITPALIIETAGQRFALPQHTVVEAVSTAAADNGSQLERVHGALVLRLREEVLPVIDLGELLRLARPQQTVAQERLVVVMRVGALTFGVLVDAVSDVQEIVVKPLGASLRRLPIFSGNTILGDGSVVLILDPPGVAASLSLEESNNFSVTPVQQKFTPPREATRLVLFRAGGGALKAVPLSLVARIETVRGGAQSTDGFAVTRYQGRLMPLVPIGDTGADGAAERPVLIIGIGAEPIGLLVSEIIDIVEGPLDIQLAGGTDGVVGTADIRGAPTDILDIAHYLRIARPKAFERAQTRFRVLLVDDTLLFRDMLAPVISAAGYEVSTAASGRDALALFSKGAVFDAVVTDIAMPEMDGYRLAQSIHEDPQRQSLPILGLDAHAAPGVCAAAEVAGMRGVVGKFDRTALVKSLAALLDAGGTDRSARESRSVEAAA